MDAATYETIGQVVAWILGPGALVLALAGRKWPVIGVIVTKVLTALLGLLRDPDFRDAVVKVGDKAKKKQIGEKQ